MRPDLAEIVEEAYRLFRCDPLETIGVCTCGRCLWSVEPAQLLTQDLRELPVEMLRDYTWAEPFEDVPAMAAGLRYQLPRMLELAAEGQELDSIDPVIGLRRLADIDFRSRWSPLEVELIDRFYDANLRDKIEAGCFLRNDRWEIAGEVRDPLVLALISGGDVERLLATFDAVPDPVGALQLAYLSAWELRRWDGPRFNDAFLRRRPDLQERLGQWLVQPEHIRRMEAVLPLVDGEMKDMVLEALTAPM